MQPLAFANPLPSAKRRPRICDVFKPEARLEPVNLSLHRSVQIGVQHRSRFDLASWHPACPIGPQVSEQMKEFVGDLPGVSAVHPKMIFDPAWSPEMMSEDAKFALGF
jgi:metal-sulfur cluster biosynthetic enzyme